MLSAFSTVLGNNAPSRGETRLITRLIDREANQSSVLGSGSDLGGAGFPPGEGWVMAAAIRQAACAKAQGGSA